MIMLIIKTLNKGFIDIYKHFKSYYQILKRAKIIILKIYINRILIFLNKKYNLWNKSIIKSHIKKFQIILTQWKKI